jgi:hypothetical protein
MKGQDRSHRGGVVDAQSRMTSMGGCPGRCDTNFLKRVGGFTNALVRPTGMVKDVQRLDDSARLCRPDAGR